MKLKLIQIYVKYPKLTTPRVAVGWREKSFEMVGECHSEDRGGECQRLPLPVTISRMYSWKLFCCWYATSSRASSRWRIASNFISNYYSLESVPLLGWELDEEDPPRFKPYPLLGCGSPSLSVAQPYPSITIETHLDQVLAIPLGFLVVSNRCCPGIRPSSAT